MLDRRHRLTTSAGFGSATRRGRRAGTRTLVLHLAAPAPVGERATAVAAASNPSAGGTATGPALDPRVGFVVGRAVGNAVRRNGVKRRLRELARGRLDALPSGAVLVVRALPAAAGATYAGLAADFDGALRRLGVPVPSTADTRPDLETHSGARTTSGDRTGAVHGR